MHNTVADYLQLQLTHTADDGLSVYTLCRDSDGRVLLGKIAQCTLKALAVIISFRTDDHRYYGTAGGSRFSHGGRYSLRP
jgi:hypothetical protein